MYKLILGLVLLFPSLNVLPHGMSEDAKAAMIQGGSLEYVWLGAEHMITGYDHLLFLFGIIFFLTSFKEIVQFITVFTLGHSLTLILATFMGVSANYWLIDALIALSVCYKGFDNNKGFQKYFGMKKGPNLLRMVFLFGLIHGLGLSTRLQELPLGEKESDILMRIISFNFGVEVGQILALGVMLVLLSRVRSTDTFKRFSQVANNGLIVAGLVLLVMQLHGLLHSLHPSEFGMKSEKSIHYHKEIELKEEYRHDNL